MHGGVLLRGRRCVTRHSWAWRATQPATCTVQVSCHQKPHPTVAAEAAVALTSEHSHVVVRVSGRHESVVQQEIVVTPLACSRGAIQAGSGRQALLLTFLPRQRRQGPRPLHLGLHEGAQHGGTPPPLSAPRHRHQVGFNAAGSSVQQAPPHRTVRQQQLLAGVDRARGFDDHVPLAPPRAAAVAVAVGDRRLEVPPAAAARSTQHTAHGPSSRRRVSIHPAEDEHPAVSKAPYPPATRARA